MAHLDSLQSGVYTSLVFRGAAKTLDQVDTLAEIVTIMAAGTLIEITNIRDFPEFGNPSNIVNIPTYGSASSTQVSGQADLNTMEFTINYVPADFDAIMPFIGDAILYPFQIALCNKRPTSFRQNTTSGNCIGGSTVAPIQNTVFNFAGKFESLVVMPSTTDATTAKLTISMATPLFGPTTYTAA
jgi:hypothetical protein